MAYDREVIGSGPPEDKRGKGGRPGEATTLAFSGADWFSIYDAGGLIVWTLPQLSRPFGLLKAGAT